MRTSLATRGLCADLLDDVDQFLRAQTIVSKGAAGLDVTVRDPDDARIIAEAVAGSADVMVTGDRDLLDLAAHSPVRIVNPRGFWEMLRADASDR
jgi:predicted nucleic acid-binding protein